ncbi:hypothetical protein LZ32DRAFT_138877 [Colletotrichum eremochloae]|nr:hypothetical protein LZ32DRAFT_138877 [Colletotrichum eremochloae]
MTTRPVFQSRGQQRPFALQGSRNVDQIKSSGAVSFRPYAAASDFRRDALGQTSVEKPLVGERRIHTTNNRTKRSSGKVR